MRVSNEVQLNIYYGYLPQYKAGEIPVERTFFQGCYNSIEEAFAVAFSILPDDTLITTDVFTYDEWNEAVKKDLKDKKNLKELKDKFIYLQRDIEGQCYVGACISPIFEREEGDDPSFF